MQLLVPCLGPFLVRAAVAAVIAGPALPATMTTAQVAPRGRIAGSRPAPSAGTGTAVTTVTRTTGGHPAAPSNTGISHAGLAPARSFTWPLSPRPAVHRRFEQPLTRWSRGHRGVDLVSGVGQPVLSAGDGVVAYSGVVAGRGVVTVRHSGGLRTSYEPVDQRLASGTRVHRGARIGALSATPGHCAPLTCLHWGAIVGHSYRDPLTLLSFGRPILLPMG